MLDPLVSLQTLRSFFLEITLHFINIGFILSIERKPKAEGFPLFGQSMDKKEQQT